jgi:hypothetical protein
MASLLNMFIGESSNIPEEKPTKTTNFCLPIEYLDESDICNLNESVIEDLEMVSQKNDETKSTCMYEHLVTPNDEFSHEMIPKLSNKFTHNTIFLKDSQDILRTFPEYELQMKESYGSYDVSYSEIMEVWKATKEDKNFMERYSFIEFSPLKYLNKMPTFLQGISLINMSSPVFSFILPFFFFLLPFIILKIQGVPITFEIYFAVLKDIAKHHFIGKALTNMSNMNGQNFLYLILLAGLYVYSLYNNYLSCIRFYKNINNVNKYLSNLQNYLKYMVKSIDAYSCLVESKDTYRKFHLNMIIQRDNLDAMYETIKHIQPFEPSFMKITEIGNLLQCFYEIHENKDFEEALKYSFGFEGYMNNLKGISGNIQNGNLHYATFLDLYEEDEEEEEEKEEAEEESKEKRKTYTEFENQYYPPYVASKENIKNDCSLKNNLIITGPNASGKTTYLKATILNIIFTQQFGVGFYDNCKLKPYTHIHSYLNIPDTSGRDSLFQAESRRCKEIIDQISNSNTNERHFCIFDELYSGTNPIEATKSAYSFLAYLSKFENVDFLLTTHYTSICDKLDSSQTIKNMKMNTLYDESTSEITYEYTISEGISKIQGAILVLKAMDYPQEIIQEINDYEE